MLLSAAILLPLAPSARAEDPNPLQIAVLDVQWQTTPLTNRLGKLKIGSDCLTKEELFQEKRLFLYDMFVIPSNGTLDQEQYDAVKTFVSKGGVFVPFDLGGTVMDIDRNGKVSLPPDLIVSSKGKIFYELTGGERLGAHWKIAGFSILNACPITQGFAAGERLVFTNATGAWAQNSAPGTIVCCGDATIMSRADGSERSRQGQAIQVKKYGKGAGIWIAVGLHSISGEPADRLLTNIFTRKTLDWCRRLPDQPGLRSN